MKNLLLLIIPFVLFCNSGCLTARVIERMNDPYETVPCRLVKIESAKTNKMGDLCIVIQGKQENELEPSYFKIECNMNSIRKNNPRDTMDCPYSLDEEDYSKTGIYKYRYIRQKNLYIMYFERYFTKIEKPVEACKDYNIDIMNNMQSKDLEIDWTLHDISYKCLQVTYIPTDAGYKSVTFVIPPGKRKIFWPFFALPFAALIDFAIFPFELIGIMSGVRYNLSKNRTGCDFHL